MNDPFMVRLIATISAVFFAMGLIHIVRGLEALAPAEAAEPSRYEERLIAMDKEAIDEAYKKHIGKLFDIWVTDYNPASGEPPRAQRGAWNARGAYTKSMEAIERREEALRSRR